MKTKAFIREPTMSNLQWTRKPRRMMRDKTTHMLLSSDIPVNTDITLPLIHGIWEVSGSHTKKLRRFKYTMHLKQYGEVIRGTCSNGYQIRGCLNINNVFKFIQTIENDSKQGAQCVCNIAPLNEPSLGVWKKLHNNQDGIFEMRYSDRNNISNTPRYDGIHHTFSGHYLMPGIKADVGSIELDCEGEIYVVGILGFFSKFGVKKEETMMKSSTANGGIGLDPDSYADRLNDFIRTTLFR